MPKVKRLAALPLLAVVIAACEGVDLMEPRFDPSLEAFVIETEEGDLHLRMELSDLAPARGDMLRIRSTVVNLGPTIPVEARICGLDLRGLELARGVSCDGYSMLADLAPGDSVVGFDQGVVLSDPGTHRLLLRHLLRPERWIAVEVVVRD